MTVHTWTQLVEYNYGIGWIDITTSTVSVSGNVSISSNADNPLAFGDASDSKVSVVVLNNVIGGGDSTGSGIRVTFTIDGTPAEVFVGTIDSQNEDDGGAVVTLDCVGASSLVITTKAYSPAFYLRPIATKTTISSVEDITNSVYAAGLLNYILWSAGGRPYEQAASYTSALFYYSLDQAILAPNWSWGAGEDGWAECQKLAQAGGGQLYQDTLGIVKYKQPINIVSGSPSYTFNSSNYGSATRSRKRGQLATKIICSYTPRLARPLQQVLDDTTPRLIHPGETITITLEPQWPLKSIETSTGLINTDGAGAGLQLATTAIVATDMAGNPILQGATGYTHTLTVRAQQITMTITNTASRPIVSWRIILRGEPITSGETGNVTQGSGAVERTISDNPYIQSAGHATRLANLILRFYSTTRAVVTLSDCVFNPSRTVGEIVNLTVSGWGVSAVAHIILSIDHSESGAKSNYQLAPVGDLPTATEYFLVSTTSVASTSKKVAF